MLSARAHTAITRVIAFYRCYTVRSRPLIAQARDIVYACNNGPDIWFVVTLDELGLRLQKGQRAAVDAQAPF